MKTYIVIDTNVLVAEFSAMREPLSTISRLSSKRLLNIVLPDFVNREFLSRGHLEIRNKLSKIRNDVNSLMRISGSPDFSVFHSALSETIKSIEENQDNLINYRYLDWKTKSRVISLEVNQGIYDSAFKGYFRGEPPFNEAKIRKDIPDSIIFHEVMLLTSSLKQDDAIFFISEDENIRKHVRDKSNKRVIVYNNLSSLLQDDTIKSILETEEKTKVERININILRNEISSHMTLIEEYCRPLIADYLLDEINFEYDEYSYTAHLEFDAIEAKSGKDLGLISYIGRGTFSMVASGIIEFRLISRQNEDYYDNGLFTDISQVKPVDEDGTGYILEDKSVDFDFKTRVNIKTGDQIYKETPSVSDIALLLIRSDFELSDVVIREVFGLL